MKRASLACAHPTRLGYLTLCSIYRGWGMHKKADELRRKAYALLTTQLEMEV